MNRQDVAALKAKIAAMPKCPECGGFALPLTPTEFACKTHGKFTPKENKR